MLHKLDSENDSEKKPSGVSIFCIYLIFWQWAYSIWGRHRPALLNSLLFGVIYFQNSLLFVMMAFKDVFLIVEIVLQEICVINEVKSQWERDSVPLCPFETVHLEKGVFDNARLTYVKEIKMTCCFIVCLLSSTFLS